MYKISLFYTHCLFLSIADSQQQLEIGLARKDHILFMNFFVPCLIMWYFNTKD